MLEPDVNSEAKLPTTPFTHVIPFSKKKKIGEEIIQSKKIAIKDSHLLCRGYRSSTMTGKREQLKKDSDPS